jgi:hypothetical protein
VLAVVGPGDWSLDRLLGLDGLHGVWWAIAAVVAGLLAAGFLLAVSYRPAGSAVDQ